MGREGYEKRIKGRGGVGWVEKEERDRSKDGGGGMGGGR